MWANERGSTLPLAAGVVLLVVVLLLAVLATAEMAVERVRQQTSADLAALAGANALCKSRQTARVIDFTIWARNTALDAMYLAAAIVSIASAGAGSEAFAVPLEFQKATIRPVELLEKSKSVVDGGAAFLAMGNSARIIKANGSQDHGLAVPLPLVGGRTRLSRRYIDLTKLITVYDRRIEIAVSQMERVLRDYELKKTELAKAGMDSDQINRTAEIQALLTKVRQTSGRVGGLTTQRNRRRRELAKLKANKTTANPGQDGVVAVVYHSSTIVPFTGVFGDVVTGDNLAVAAARVEDGPNNVIIGEEAVKNLLGKGLLGPAGARGAGRLMESVNLVGGKLRGMGRGYGPLGQHLHAVLEKLGLIPPALNESRPALARVDSVLSDTSQVYGVIQKWLALSKQRAKFR